MTKTETTSKRPTHRVYAVTKTEGSDKGFWTTIGAAWAHQDGKGYSVKLDYLPLHYGTVRQFELAGGAS